MFCTAASCAGLASAQAGLRISRKVRMDKHLPVARPLLSKMILHAMTQMDVFEATLSLTRLLFEHVLGFGGKGKGNRESLPMMDLRSSCNFVS